MLRDRIKSGDIKKPETLQVFYGNDNEGSIQMTDNHILEFTQEDLSLDKSGLKTLRTKMLRQLRH